MKRQAFFRARRPQMGFSLIELMITVTLVAIMAALAAPSFRSLMARQRIKTASADLVSHLTLSRSEAIKQNSDVTMTSSSGDSSWTNGWTISSVGGPVGTHVAFTGIVISTGSGGPSSVVYNRSGRLTMSGTSTTFQISDASSGSTVTGRCVTIGVTGQATSIDGSCS